jgi:hypothetical protein
LARAPCQWLTGPFATSPHWLSGCFCSSVSRWLACRVSNAGSWQWLLLSITIASGNLRAESTQFAQGRQMRGDLFEDLTDWPASSKNTDPEGKSHERGSETNVDDLHDDGIPAPDAKAKCLNSPNHQLLLNCVSERPNHCFCVIHCIVRSLFAGPLSPTSTLEIHSECHLFTSYGVALCDSQAQRETKSFHRIDSSEPGLSTLFYVCVIVWTHNVERDCRWHCRLT